MILGFLTWHWFFILTGICAVIAWITEAAMKGDGEK